MPSTIIGIRDRHAGDSNQTPVKSSFPLVGHLATVTVEEPRPVEIPTLGVIHCGHRRADIPGQQEKRGAAKTQQDYALSVRRGIG
jgi:hypothetical protein